MGDSWDFEKEPCECGNKGWGLFDVAGSSVHPAQYDQIQACDQCRGGGFFNDDEEAGAFVRERLDQWLTWIYENQGPDALRNVRPNEWVFLWMPNTPKWHMMPGYDEDLQPIELEGEEERYGRPVRREDGRLVDITQSSFWEWWTHIEEKVPDDLKNPPFRLEQLRKREKEREEREDRARARLALVDNVRRRMRQLVGNRNYLMGTGGLEKLSEAEVRDLITFVQQAEDELQTARRRAKRF